MAKSSDSSLLVVILNADKVLEYDRNVALSNKQLADLDFMDKKLDQELASASRSGQTSDLKDKATFVANLLVAALLDEDEPKIALTCAYLGTRFDELKQIKARTQADQLAIQLIFDQEYRPATPLKFVAKKDLN